MAQPVARPLSTRFRSGRPWETIPLETGSEPVSALRHVTARPVRGSSSLRAIEFVEESGDRPHAMLCVRAEAEWACGGFDVARRVDERQRMIERIEILDDEHLLVQSSMDELWGIGEGATGAGTSELYVVRILGDSLIVRGWFALGAVHWVKVNHCAVTRLCYHLELSRAYHPWSVPEPGVLEIAPRRTERGTATMDWTIVRRAGGRTRPIGALTGPEAQALIADAFALGEAVRPEAEGPTWSALRDDIHGRWAWDRIRFRRIESSQ